MERERDKPYPRYTEPLLAKTVDNSALRASPPVAMPLWTWLDGAHTPHGGTMHTRGCACVCRGSPVSRLGSIPCPRPMRGWVDLPVRPSHMRTWGECWSSMPKP